MRVLLLAPPLAKAGGIQRYTFTLARALKDVLGESAVRIVMLEEDSSRSNTQLSGVSKWRFGCRVLWETVQWRSDLVICMHLALGPVGYFVAGIGRQPYWVVVHGIEAWVPLPFAKRFALRRANRLIATTTFNRETVMKKHQIKADHFVNLPCTVNESLTAVEPANKGPHKFLSHDQCVILTVARMAAAEQYKGQDAVLRALPSVLLRVPNLIYVMAGDGDDRPRIEALVEKLGLRSHVMFTGTVTDQELAALYHRCDVFALPARTVITDREAKGEGFGIVFLEAMAFGKPVIGPNDGAPAEILRHGQHGLLVDPNHPAAIAEALVELLTNPNKSHAMGQAGKDWVHENYSYGRFRERVRDILADNREVHGAEKTLPNPSRKKTIAVALLEGVFTLWVIAVNYLYFLQYKSLLVARFAHLLHR